MASQGLSSAHRGDIATPETSKSASSATELEEEIRRSRAERAKRRSQTVGVVSPLQVDASDYISTNTITSGDDTLRKLLGERGGVRSPLEDTISANTMKTAYSPPSLSSSSPPKRTNALLERYGGAAGPTGVAKAGANGSPASLANFIGGKANGPRLGKLQGDGRNAPPEAAEYMASRALPGMTSGSSGGGKGLASFLEARASGQENVRSPSPTKTTFSNSGTSSRPLASRNDSATLAVTTQTYTSIERHDRATSPLKAGQAVAIKTPNIEAEKPLSKAHSPTSKTPAVSPPVSAPATGISPAFSATQSGIDRMPTASLTRLKSKKMVEQRVREAQERAGAEPSPSSSPVLRSAPAWMTSTPFSTDADAAPGGLKGRWPAVDKQPSPTLEKKNAFTPATFGNALPGMGQSRTVPTRNLYASNRREADESREVYSPPIRLPGMGSAQSPFAAKPAAMESKESEQTATQPLEQLAKGRAKPKRTVRAAPIEETAKAPIAISEATPEERISRQDFSAAREAFSHTSQRTPSPRKLQLHITTDPETPSRPSRQDSIPDSADKRLADSSAALEALLEGKREKTPTLERSKMVFVPDKVRQSGTLKIARNKDSDISIDTSAIQRSAVRRNVSNLPKSISVEVAIVKSDGSLETLSGDEGRVLYESETQIITHRFKESTSSSSVSTKVYARSGIRSRLLVDPNCLEAKRVQETGKLHRTVIVDARQGRESRELVKLMGGSLVTREGSRREGERLSTSMYQVRGSDGAYLIDQVDMLTSSLCSAYSAVIVLQGDLFVWHGTGSTISLRLTALQYARQLKSDSRQRFHISEHEEGKEDELFWACFDKSAPFSNAWHHQFTPHLADSDLQPRLFSIQGTDSTKRLYDQTDFSLIDVRRDGIHILQLPLEVYVLVGPDARSRRKEIQICIEAASSLAKEVSHRRGSSIMTPPVHVVVFPTIAPRELKSAFRYWHDEHLNGKGWQRAGLGMNVWERQSALQQLNCTEFPLWQVNDELFLPVGVGLEDVQGIDV